MVPKALAPSVATSDQVTNCKCLLLEPSLLGQCYWDIRYEVCKSVVYNELLARFFFALSATFCPLQWRNFFFLWMIIGSTQHEWQCEYTVLFNTVRQSNKKLLQKFSPLPEQQHFFLYLYIQYLPTRYVNLVNEASSRTVCCVWVQPHTMGWQCLRSFPFLPFISLNWNHHSCQKQGLQMKGQCIKTAHNCQSLSFWH